jgi:hypothetical protein
MKLACLWRLALWRHTPRKVASVPHIPLLAENNVRKGFFEHEQISSDGTDGGTSRARSPGR